MPLSPTSTFVTAAAAVVCAACASSAQKGAAPLATGEWLLVDIAGVAAVPEQMDRRPTIRFSVDSARATGNGGCNS